MTDKNYGNYQVAGATWIIGKFHKINRSFIAPRSERVHLAHRFRFPPDLRRYRDLIRPTSKQVGRDFWVKSREPFGR
ncbi:hypothetical protein [Novipirellula maiorica]|nr:hypothetical protein [Rhodopirellula maiorica]